MLSFCSVQCFWLHRNCSQSSWGVHEGCSGGGKISIPLQREWWGKRNHADSIHVIIYYVSTFHHSLVGYHWCQAWFHRQCLPLHCSLFDWKVKCNASRMSFTGYYCLYSYTQYPQDCRYFHHFPNCACHPTDKRAGMYQTGNPSSLCQRYINCDHSNVSNVFHTLYLLS